jgi:hypothetical protein
MFWWTTERARFKKGDGNWFDCMVCTVGYAICKNMNALCFCNTHHQHSVSNMTRFILEEFSFLRTELGIGVGAQEHTVRE